MKWETEAPEGPLHEDQKVSQDLLDSLVSKSTQVDLKLLTGATCSLKWVSWSQASLANLAMVAMVAMGRGDLLVFLGSPVYQDLLVQLVLMVTVTHQPATSRQGPPTSLWTWKDLQGTESHSGRDRKTVGLTPLGTQRFSQRLTRSCGWWGALYPLASNLVSMPTTAPPEEACLDAFKKACSRFWDHVNWPNMLIYPTLLVPQPVFFIVGFSIDKATIKDPPHSLNLNFTLSPKSVSGNDLIPILILYVLMYQR